MAAINETTVGAIGHYVGRARSHAVRAEELARNARCRATETLSALPDGCIASETVLAVVGRAEEAAVEARAAARVAERIAAVLCSNEGFDIALEVTKLARVAEAEAARAIVELRHDTKALHSQVLAGRCLKCSGPCVHADTEGKNAPQCM